MVRGVVEHGDQRGRLLGFPTANLSIEGVVIPDGVWAGWFERASGERHGAAISIGSRPTFYGRDGARLIEVHVLDLDADLYDEVVTVWLVTRLRAQRRFKSIEALVEQLRADVTASRAWCTAGWQPDDTEVPLRVGQGLVLNGEMLAG